ncbi:hypothetical protein BDR04DRAFT_1163944, partial [Suillus decipiens]
PSSQQLLRTLHEIASLLIHIETPAISALPELVSNPEYPLAEAVSPQPEICDPIFAQVPLKAPNDEISQIPVHNDHKCRLQFSCRRHSNLCLRAPLEIIVAPADFELLFHSNLIAIASGCTFHSKTLRRLQRVRLPSGVGGKDTSTLNHNWGSNGGNAGRLAVGTRRNRVVILISRNDFMRDHEARRSRNEGRADRTGEGPAEPSSNTPLINLAWDFNALTPTSRAVAQAIVGGTSSSAPSVAQGTTSFLSKRAYDDAETRIASSIDVISLAIAGLHAPFTLLTASAIEKMHTGPSCITMKKGFVLDDLKKSVLDTSTFPAEPP